MTETSQVPDERRKRQEQEHSQRQKHWEFGRSLRVRAVHHRPPVGRT
jgi:hypothetical protein